MIVRVGINGFGRIGRGYLRTALERGIDVVAVNDMVEPRTLAYLLAHDSTYGPLDRQVEHDTDTLLVDGTAILALSEADPVGLPWKDLGVDLVIESTGRLRSRDEAAAHLHAGAQTVLLTAPGKDVDATIVLGVNESIYDPAAHQVISAASCTTNCVAPMVTVLHERFGVVKGFMTTIHSYTNDQVLLDSPHKDLRRGRSAAVNLIPTSTGAARSVGLVIPELAGCFDGVAVRAPVEDGSLVDLAVTLAGPVSTEQVNAAFAESARGNLGGVLRYAAEPMVSRDVVGDPASCVFDPYLTQASGELVKVFGWYDNEWGYVNRLADLTEIVARHL